MNDLLNIELVNDNLERFDDPWENILMALEKENQKTIFWKALPSTCGEVDSHAECLSATSFRSDSPQRDEELLEV